MLHSTEQANSFLSYFQWTSTLFSASIAAAMAVTFSDLHTEAGLKSLDAFLSGKTYISGSDLASLLLFRFHFFLIIQFICWWLWFGDFSLFRDVLTKDDIKVYAAVSEKPGDSFPNASRWYGSVSAQLASRFVLRFRFWLNLIWLCLGVVI